MESRLPARVPWTLRLVTYHRSPVTVVMYRKPRFLEELHAIREEMSRDCDYDVDLFAEMVRSGQRPHYGPARNIRGLRSRAPAADAANKRNSHSGQSND